MESRPAPTWFVHQLNRTLHHLYDPGELVRSPLVALTDLRHDEDPALSLRRLLLDAIAALKPASNVQQGADAWRIYQILSLRYAEQVSQTEAATDLALSVRQLRRQQTRAVKALADYLWARYNLQHVSSQPSPHFPVLTEASATDMSAPSRQEEMEWLRQSFPNQVTDLEELIQAVLKTVTRLAQELRVHLECKLPAGLPGVSAQPTALRQALLNVLTVAIHAAQAGSVSLEVQNHHRSLVIRIQASGERAAASPLLPEDAESLEMAQQLIALSGGSLSRGCSGTVPFGVELALPSARQAVVLVIDDNADTRKLFERYLVGTRYRFHGTPDPQQVLTATEGPAPDMIILDVMLPGIDGWELLGRLREHPRTCKIPVVVCTILPQERLAFSLGAAAFLRKPVSRRDFLSTLDREMTRQEQDIL